MIDKEDKKLSITDQAQLLSINRTSLYYKPVPIGDEEYHIKWFIDEIYTAHPEYNEPRKQDRQNRENKLEWDHGKETKFYT